jgi:5'(3')-deoxyribonucleotidase
MNIYLDMDDVVADWMPAARAIVNRNWEYGERIPDSDWDKVKAKARFYRDLPIKSGAYELVEYCKQLTSNTNGTLQFLTALPHDYSVPHASYDKVMWATERFPDIPVLFGIYSYDKWKHCKNSTDVLIDDRTSNCEEWINAGGQAHIYRNWPDCKEWFENILSDSANR